MVTGRVTDAQSGQPLGNVNIRVVGTTNGGQTNEQGQYTLRAVAPGAVQLQVSRIGYTAQTVNVTVAAGQTATQNIQLGQAAFSLSAVVTTVTGQQRKVELANTTAQIDLASKVAELPATNMGTVLSGRAAGVQVVNGGATGSGSRIRIRGQSSLSLNSNPVVIIDGVRMTSTTNDLAVGTGGNGPSRLDDLNPDEIENIEVIKGPSAATLYGTEAANGVISITTKKGKAGRTRYTFYTENGVINNSRDFPELYSLWGAKQNGTYGICTLANVLAGSSAATGCTRVDSLSSGNILNIDSLSVIGTGNRQQYGGQVSGGNDRVQFFVSGETEGETGIYEMTARDQRNLQTLRGVSSLPGEQIRPNALQRNSFRANLQSTLARGLNVQIASGYINSLTRFPQNEDNSSGLMVNAMGATWRTDLPDPAGNPLLGARSWSAGEVFSRTAKQGINRFINSIAAQYTPTEWLTARATVGYDATVRADKAYNRVNEGPYEGQTRLGQVSNFRTEQGQRTVDLGGTGTFNIIPGVQTKTSVGMQFIRNLTVQTGATGQTLPPGALTVTQAAIRSSSEQTIDRRTLGYYAEEVVSVNDKLFITGGVRRDAASAFGEDFRAVWYPKVGASWLVSDMGFFPRPNWLQTFRVRATYGASGQIPSPTGALRSYSANPLTLASGEAPSVSLDSLGNSNLKPEFSAELESGFDLTLFDGRTNFELTYYDKNTKDAIINRAIAPSVAGVATRLENIGSIQNRGLELVLNQTLVDNRQFGASFTLTGSTNRNRLKSLAPGVSAIFTGNRNTQRNQPGYPLFGLWSRTYTYADANNDGILALSEMQFTDSASFIGATFPTREMAFSPTIEVLNRKLRFSGQLDAKWGFRKFNNTLRHMCQGGASCRGLYDKSADLETQAAALAVNQVGVFAGMFEKGDFARFREASVAYELPGSLAARVRAQRLSVILTGRNLATFTNYKGVDPESSQSNSDTRGNEEFFATPPLRYLTIRLNANF
ncbi:SusC/RagA family TonB-linked outer membrane protein [Roseisolibacter sp. H3M3-2]|uniref:SusC/RagA family TonB-linked outer membrane protein n=1 Tax=Roseisolibacter sp. H3M3-2 TaxID=3031323 RepID=UPI0023DA52AF|nr:SusC/RagA family TonB-linked outer membrane protein [Roseisolibacter sp. H3M3-2]MDF1503078.1 SusC/RagA family TonB-linked outer membrane protein [Roseisolibacter sp. H3M3-2]